MAKMRDLGLHHRNPTDLKAAPGAIRSHAQRDEGHGGAMINAKMLTEGFLRLRERVR